MKHSEKHAPDDRTPQQIARGILDHPYEYYNFEDKDGKEVPLTFLGTYLSDLVGQFSADGGKAEKDAKVPACQPELMDYLNHIASGIVLPRTEAKNFGEIALVAIKNLRAEAIAKKKKFADQTAEELSFPESGKGNQDMASMEAGKLVALRHIEKEIRAVAKKLDIGLDEPETGRGGRS